MRKGPLSLLIICVGFAFALQSCRNDEYLTTPPPVADQTFVEEFDTVSSALSRGWVLVNSSDPKGSNVWQQGGSVAPWFSPYSSNGTYAGFIGADYTSTSAAAGTISNWLISPAITMQNGDKIVFYTRALQYPDFDPLTGLPNGDTTDYGNRLQVRLNISNDGTNVGNGYEPGSFSTPLLDINSTYIPSGVKPATASPLAYPSQWTRFEATVSGLNNPVRGRFALRYFVEDGGFNGLGSGVAIDKVSYTSVNHK
jgi:hypothetical protein